MEISGDGRVTCAPDATVAVGVTLVLPEARAEYEEARASVERLAREAGGGEASRPANTNGTNGTYAMTGANCWVVTTGDQRRAWGLPDLGGVATIPIRARDDLQRAWNRGAVPLVDADDAVRLLAGNDGDKQADDDNDTYGANGARAFGPVRPEHAASEFVNLKHGRRPTSAYVRETFDELTARARIDALVDALDAVHGLLGGEDAATVGGDAPRARVVAPVAATRAAAETVARAPEHRTVGRRRAHLRDGLHPLRRRARRVAATLALLDSSLLPDGELSLSEVVQFIEQGPPWGHLERPVTPRRTDENDQPCPPPSSGVAA